MYTRFQFVIGVMVLLVVGGALYAVSWRRAAPLSRDVYRHTSTMLDPAFFDEAYRRAPSYPAPDPQTRGGIVPHHLLAAPLLAGYFESLKSLKPTRVIIIGPDHLMRSRAPVVVTHGAWKTPYGLLAANEPEVARLVDRGLAVEEPDLFDVEHSIAAIVPFVRRSLPRAKIVPILVNRRLSPDAAERLARALPIDDRTIVLASVDFSHYLPSRVALFHDRMSRAALSSFSFDDLDRLEVDSPQSLRVLLHAMAALDARRATFVDNKTGAELSQSPETPETTSYVLTRFAVGDPFPEKTTTTLIYPFTKRINTAEDRFFIGQNAVVEPKVVPSRTSLVLPLEKGELEGVTPSHRVTLPNPPFFPTQSRDPDPDGVGTREGVEIVFGGSGIHDPVLDVQRGHITLTLPNYGRSASVGVVSGPEGTDLYLFPMEFNNRGIRFLLGREETSALYSIDQQPADDQKLRTQIRSGIIHLPFSFPPPT